MQILKNKHLIMAMFIAPVLAIIAYFAVDHVVSEVPHAAVQGSSYKLAARSNCRYESGTCTLENGDIEIKLRAEYLGDNYLKIILNSAVPVNNVLISFVDQDMDASEHGSMNEPLEPILMIASSDQAMEWTANIVRDNVDRGVMRLALNIADVLYYAETTTVFFDYETSFSRDNFPH